jgi:hypothetical protein
MLILLPCIQSLSHAAVHSLATLRQPHIRGLLLRSAPSLIQTIKTFLMALALRTEIRLETRLSSCRDLITIQHIYSVPQNLRTIYCINQQHHFRHMCVASTSNLLSRILFSGGKRLETRSDYLGILRFFIDSVASLEIK